MNQDIAKDLYVKITAIEMIVQNILDKVENDNPGFKSVLLQALASPRDQPQGEELSAMFGAFLKEAKRIIEKRG